MQDIIILAESCQKSIHRGLCGKNIFTNDFYIELNIFTKHILQNTEKSVKCKICFTISYHNVKANIH